MNNHIQEIEHLLDWIQLVYGTEYYLDGQLVEPIPDEKPQKMERQAPGRSNVLQEEINGWADGLRSFYEEIKECQNCGLGKTRKHFVFGMGNSNADIVFVGEAPGKDEDEQGLPFVGRAGKLLDKMLFTITLNREDIFIANVLKCRPPNNRDPLPDEVIQCEPYLKKQLDLIRPKVLVALGRVSAQVLLKQHDSLSALRKTIQNYEGIPLVVTYHPAALLRNPQWKRNAWDDLKKIKQILNRS